MKTILLLIASLLTGQVYASTFNVNSSQSVATIQGVITAASVGDTIQFAAGTYNLGSSSFSNLCGKILTGPTQTNFGVNSVPTAVLTGTSDSYAFAINSCLSGTTTIWNFDANPVVLVVIGNNNNTGIDIEFNKQFGSQTNPAIWFSGSLPGNGSPLNGTAPNNWIGNFIQNVVIKNNILGSAGDCTAIFASSADGGQCNGIHVGVGTFKNVDIESNYIFHKQEPIHIVQLGSFIAGATTNPSSVCIGVTVANNVVLDFHRIGIEIQCAEPAGQGYGGLQFNHNYSGEAVSATGGSFLFSLACCQDAGFYQGDGNTPRPSLITNDLVGTDLNTCCVNEMPVGMEWWEDAGTGAYHLYQGRIQKNALVWGRGVGPRTLDHMIVQTLNGPPVAGCASLTTCPPIHDEGYNTATPTITNATYSIGPSYVTQAYPAVTPTIAPTSFTTSSTVSVTITDSDSANRALSYFYTTDGTTPKSFVSGGSNGTSKLYTGAFTVNPGTTVKSVARWGKGMAAQGVAFPPNAGYIDSPVQSATYTSGTPPVLTGVTFSFQDGIHSIQAGNSDLGCALMTYVGGGNGGLVCGPGADAFGTNPSGWTSSNTSVATIANSGTGEASTVALTAGTTNMTVQAGSFTSPAFALTVTSAAPVQTGTNISCPTTLTLGNTTTCTCQAIFTGPTIQACTSPAFVSNTPSVATIGASSGLVTGVSSGTASMTVTAGSCGASCTSSPAAITVSIAAPAATLASAVVSFNPASVQIGSTDAAVVNCNYNLTAGGTQQTNCTTADQYGNDASAFTTSAGGVATVNATSGVATGVATGNTNIGCTVTGTATVTCQTFSLAVTAAPATNILGNNQQTITGSTHPNFADSTYAVTGSFTSTVASCSINLEGSHTAGALWDCILTLGTATTQNAASLCHATYTAVGTAADAGWHTLPITGCGTLVANQGYWVGRNTNEAGATSIGTWDCANGATGCAGAAPTVANGTYPYRSVSATYGVYTGVGTTMSPTTAPGGTGYQQAQYVTLTTPTPTLVGAFLLTAGNVQSLAIGQTAQFAVAAAYSDGTNFLASPSADLYGDVVTSYTSSAPSVMTIGAVGSAHPGVATAISVGTATMTAVVSSTKTSTPYVMTVTVTPTPLPPLTSRSFIAR